MASHAIRKHHDLMSFESDLPYKSKNENRKTAEDSRAGTSNFGCSQSLDNNVVVSIDTEFDEERSLSSRIQVSVSGETYSLEQSVFHRMERLPWKRPCDVTAIEQTQWNNTTNGELYHLQTSPYIFEILLHFITNGYLPNLELLSNTDLEELEPMAAILDLRELLRHFEEKKKKQKFSLLRSGSTLRSSIKQRRDKKNQLKQEQERKLQCDMLMVQQLSSFTSDSIEHCLTLSDDGFPLESIDNKKPTRPTKLSNPLQKRRIHFIRSKSVQTNPCQTDYSDLDHQELPPSCAFF